MRKIVLWILILLIPTQLGLHFWPEFSFVSGLKIDYLSPTIYLIDIFLVFFLALSWKKLSLNPLLLILVSLNIFFSTIPLLSLFFWAKLLIYILLFTSLLKTKNLKEIILPPLLLSIIVVIIIQLIQLFLQSSIGGPLYFLGERSFSFHTPNIAKLNTQFLGVLIRPYSTFSHPNSLAGYLLLSLVILKSYSQKKYIKYLKYIKLLVSLAVILTFSKIAIFTLLLLEIKHIKTLKKIIWTALLVSFLPLLVVFTNLNYVPANSFLTRAFMGYSTTKIIKQNIITGTGLRAFIPSLSTHIAPSHLKISSLQPVHSLPLLALAELGLVGIILLIIILKKTRKTTIKTNTKNLLLIQTLLVLVLTGAVDHYWWTLPQNQLILILVLALSLKHKHESKEKIK